MPGISIALTPVEACGMSRGRGVAGQVNGLEMLIAKGEFRALPKGTGAWTDIWCVNNASGVWDTDVVAGKQGCWRGITDTALG